MMISDDQPNKMVLDETTEFTDMVVIIGAERIQCHKAIVCRYSTIIGMAMKANMKEGITGEFTITEENITVDDVRQFLLAMYDSWDRTTMEPHVLGMYRLACVYQSRRVKDMTVNVLGRLLVLAQNPKESGDVKTTGTIRLKIDSFKSFTLDGQSRTSNKITICGMPWKFELQSDMKNGVSFYVSCCNNDTRNNFSWWCTAKATIRVKSQAKGTDDFQCTTRVNRYDAKSTSWGWESFMEVSEILDDKNAYCVNDTVTFEATIDVTSSSYKTFWTIATANNGHPCPALAAKCAEYLAKDANAGYYFGSDDGQFEWAKKNYPALVLELACPVANSKQEDVDSVKHNSTLLRYQHLSSIFKKNRHSK